MAQSRLNVEQLRRVNKPDASRPLYSGDIRMSKDVRILFPNPAIRGGTTHVYFLSGIGTTCLL